MSIILQSSKLILPISMVACLAFSPIAKGQSGTPPTTVPDSTFTIPISVANKDSRPTVVVEKQVIIPTGYAYVSHNLSLVSAFPTEGAEQTANWISGPEHTWNIYAKIDSGPNVPDRITVKATAAPGRKNMEIEAQATLTVALRRLRNTN